MKQYLLITFRCITELTKSTFAFVLYFFLFLKRKTDKNEKIFSQEFVLIYYRKSGVGWVE